MGGKCWPRLFTPSDRSSACLVMKRPTTDCYASLGDLWMAWRCLRGCWRPGLCCCVDMCEIRGFPFCDPVELVEGDRTYSVVRSPDGRESTVSTSDLSPCPPHDECEDPPTLPSQKLTVWASATWEEAADEADGMRGEEVENDQDSVPGHCQWIGFATLVYP